MGADVTLDTDLFEHLATVSRNRPRYRAPRAAEALKGFTPARVGVGRCGSRPLSRDVLNFRADHAAARDTIHDFVAEDLIDRHRCTKVQTLVEDKEQYLLRPDLGRRLRSRDAERLRDTFGRGARVLLMVGDGLSANAIESNLDDILPSLRIGLEMYDLEPSAPIFVKFSRVAVMDHVGELLEPETVVLLIGERPGLMTSASMSAYLCYRPRLGTVEADRNVVSNIHRAGIPPLEAGAVIADLIHTFLTHGASGVNLKALIKARGNRA